MTGYALEVKLIKWKCSCKTHVNGACANSVSNKSEELRTAYLGSFGYGIKHLADALRKWDRWCESERGQA